MPAANSSSTVRANPKQAAIGPRQKRATLRNGFGAVFHCVLASLLRSSLSSRLTISGRILIIFGSHHFGARGTCSDKSRWTWPSLEANFGAHSQIGGNVKKSLSARGRKERRI
jgi:hypothetical protein